MNIVHDSQHIEVDRASVAWSGPRVLGGSNLTESTERWALEIDIIKELWSKCATIRDKSLSEADVTAHLCLHNKCNHNGFTYEISAIIQQLTTKLYIQCVIISQLFSWLQKTPLLDKSKGRICIICCQNHISSGHKVWNMIGSGDIIRMQRGYKRDHVEVIH